MLNKVLFIKNKYENLTNSDENSVNKRFVNSWIIYGIDQLQYYRRIIRNHHFATP